jgi:hypothetical protein
MNQALAQKNGTQSDSYMKMVFSIEDDGTLRIYDGNIPLTIPPEGVQRLQNFLSHFRFPFE